MSELIPITVGSIVLALLSHNNSSYDYINFNYVKKDRFFFTIMAIAMILVCGLRTAYNDTGTYQLIYDSIPANVDLFEDIEWFNFGENPGFTFTNRILVRLGFSTQSFLMFYAAITLGLYLWFLRKYSCNLPLTIFLFITFAGYIFTFAAIKQCMAMAICLLATDRAIQKRYISFVILVLLACAFHAYAIMYLAVPFLMFRPWSGKTVLMLGAFVLIGFSMEYLLGTILKFTDAIGENYSTDTLTGQGVNPFRLAAVSVPVLLSFYTRSVISSRNDRVHNLMLNLTMLNAELMFVALFGTANYFARLANYFLTFQALSIPWLFTHFEEKSKRLVTNVGVFCYVLFFIYSQAIHESFDGNYFSITLTEYLKSLFAS